MYKLFVGGIIFGIVLEITLVSFTMLRVIPEKPLSPKSAITTEVLATNSTKREIIGFLPYWNLSSVNYLPVSKLTTIYYFALDVDGEGNFNKSDGGYFKTATPEFSKLLDLHKANPNLRLGITIVSLKADDIARVVNNDNRQKRLINNTIGFMKKYGFQDLNFDLEYVGTIETNTVNNYTKLVRNITDEVHSQIPGSKVSLDAYSDSVAKKRIFDIPQIGKIVDQVIIMGYDFHRINSDIAGPVAPLFGKEKYEYDVYSAVTDYISVVSPEKVILAVPFYGYEWPTVGPEIGSLVASSYRGPEIASYKRAIQNAKENNVSINFDDISKSVWYSYFDNDHKTYRQVWFENERSLGLKFDLINQANLGGLGIWALGYDGEGSNLLWQTVSDKFPN